jgi:hypothetical protein
LPPLAVRSKGRTTAIVTIRSVDTRVKVTRISHLLFKRYADSGRTVWQLNRRPQVGVHAARSAQLDRHGALVEPKTKAAKQDVPIPPSLGSMLTGHKREAFRCGYAKPTDYVLAATSGAPMNHRNLVRRALEKALENSGLPHLKWHDLRRVAASAAEREHADENARPDGGSVRRDPRRAGGMLRAGMEHSHGTVAFLMSHRRMSSLDRSLSVRRQAAPSRLAAD